MRLHATGRDLIITEKERLISGSINIYTCEFILDSSWDGYMVTAVFSTANRLVNKAVVDGKCEIPTEVLRPNTRLRIGIFGNDGVRTRPTTYSEWIPVEQGADTGGRTGRPPSPTVYEEWMNALDKQYDEWAKAEAEREAAEKLRGNSAVYVGSGDIHDGYNIQIDPEGEYIFGGPKIENGTWWLWDEDTGDYVDTGVPATGPKGDPGGAVLTEADKTDLVAQVLAALPNGDDTKYPEGDYVICDNCGATFPTSEDYAEWQACPKCGDGVLTVPEGGDTCSTCGAALTAHGYCTDASCSTRADELYNTCSYCGEPANGVGECVIGSSEHCDGMTKCSNCGLVFLEQDGACPDCGTPVGEGEPPIPDEEG